MKIFSFNTLALFLTVILLTSCSKYNKLLKSTDNELKYKAALNYYNKGDYARATPLLETLAIPFNGTPRADTVKFYEAKGYYMIGDNYVADTYLADFCRIYGRSVFAEEAYYLKAMNLYEMSLRPDLDQEATIKALAAINDFNTRYPESKFEKDDNKMKNDLQGRLELKSYNAAKLYYQIEDYKAAVVALRNSIKDYPESKYKEELMFLTLKSSYLYAKKSVTKKQPERYIAAIDEYYNFLSEYPNSPYTKDARDMYNDALKHTRKLGVEVEEQTIIKEE